MTRKQRSLIAGLLVCVLVTAGCAPEAPDSAQPGDTLRITVYGGTGNIGSRIVTEAVNRGHEVTVIVRNPDAASGPAFEHPSVRVRGGDVLDSDSVAETLAGQDVVISAVGSGGNNPEDPREGLYLRAAQSLVQALRAAGSDAYLIVVGGAGSLEVEPGRLLSEGLDGAVAREVMAQQVALDYYRTVDDVRWTYVSPSLQILPGERTGQFRLGTDRLLRDGDGESRISMEDYAMALIDEAEQPRHEGRRFTVGY